MRGSWVRLFGCLLLLSTAACGRIGFELVPKQKRNSLTHQDAGADGVDSGSGSGIGSGSVDGGDAGGNAGTSGGGSGGTGSNPGDGGATNGTGGTSGSNGDAGVDGGVLPTDTCVLDVCASDVDRCTSDPDKTSPGICGCDVADGADADKDGTPDCNDRCADAPDVLGDGTCGCTAAAADDDGDGTQNCHDRCPDDHDKTQPAICGCSVSDADADGDGMPDCADGCVDDAKKVVPGKCGCGVTEDTNDTDNDGTIDCFDACSGANDASYVPDASCGVGYCKSHNTPSTCASGAETACMPGAPLSSDDATCDGIDDDCSGGADEEYVTTPTNCGVGACAASGTLTCSGGTTHDSCTPGTPAANDASCNGVDEDCSGTADEDYVQTATSCGVGACARAGMLSCSNGSVSDSCAPGTPAANDASCDGVDQDCSGSADEDYVPTVTNCGAGVCATTGMMICMGGGLINTCVAGTGAPNDATCNGSDDDCDGTKDEDYVSTPTNCGVGACAKTGSMICSNGAATNTCKPGTPAANDASCNNVDDDCNGQKDEDYAPDATCGVGYCKAHNTPSSCSAGVVTACQPSAPRANNDTTNDGVDDDCDGKVDENACPNTTVAYSATGLTNITVPSGCTQATVRLWGAGGASGSGGGGYYGSVTAGRGGPGGFTQRAFTVTTATTIALRIGQGGQNCGNAGTNVNAIYSGGAGSTSRNGNGTAGKDGTEAGGAGGVSSGAGDGGKGNFGGGGGGGGGGPAWNPFGGGGGGGAATVVLVGSTRLLAGGGGGGGGAGSTIASSGVGGSAGGSGCGAAGTGQSNAGGGGGGGGKCDGTTNQTSSARTPYLPAGVTLPSNTAAGGDTTSDCMAGGNGYATITWAP